IEALANRFADWAESAGVRRGDTVALVMPNRLEYVPCWMGLAKRGVSTALINTNLQGAALAHSLSISGASHVITDAGSLDMFDTIRVQLARPLTIWVIDGEGELGTDRLPLDLKHPALPPERPPRS